MLSASPLSVFSHKVYNIKSEKQITYSTQTNGDQIWNASVGVLN